MHAKKTSTTIASDGHEGGHPGELGHDEGAHGVVNITAGEVGEQDDSLLGSDITRR